MRPRPLLILGSVVIAATAVTVGLLVSRRAPPAPSVPQTVQAAPEAPAASAPVAEAPPAKAVPATAPKQAPVPTPKTAPTPAPAVKPAEKLAEKPVAKPVEKPAEKPAEKVTPAPAPTTQAAAAPATTTKAAAAPATTAPAATPAPAAVPATAAEGPAMRIDSPAPGSVYHSSVLLVGRITDSGTATSARQVGSVTWSIEGTDRSGSVSLSGNGDFRVKVPTDGLQSALTVVLRAERKGGGTSEKSLALTDSGQGPRVSILTPAAGTPYGSSVKVTGLIAGPADAPDPLSEVDTVSWGVEGTELGSRVSFAKDGSFGFSFSTVGQRGALSVAVQATDRNGHRSSASLLIPDRTGGPPIEVDAPADTSGYGDAVAITGHVGDTSDPSALPAEVKSLGWRVLGSAKLAGSASVQKDGSFKLTVATAGLSGAQVVELRAEDLNGRSTVRAITLQPAQPASAEAVTPAGRQQAAGASSSAAAAAPAGSGAARAAPTPPALPPALVVASPMDNATYASAITVSGTATNSAADAAAGLVASVSWGLTGTSLKGTADVGADGKFSFTVRTAGLRGTQALSVRATGKAGLTAEKLIVLLDSGRGIPIQVTSPVDGGFYKAATAVEGIVGDAATIKELKSLTWELPGHAELTGRVVADSGGKFRFAVPIGQITGDIVVRLTSEDFNGHTEQANLALHDGTQKPVITVSAPAKGAPYGSMLRVAGVVNDPYAGHPGMEGIDTVSWLVSAVDFSRASTPVRGTSLIGPGGSFRFSVPAKGLSGQQDLTLTAAGKSGNRGELTVRIPQGTSDLPGFAVTPADRRVTLSWDPVPFAARYDLAWVPGEAAPESGTVQQGVTSPLTLGGLDDGALYSLRLQITYDDGGAGASALTRVIPLAPQTLAPTVTSDYLQIRLAWDKVPGASAYDVWRSTTANGGFVRVAAALPSAVYVDTGVEFGKDYFYSIAPAGPLAPLSTPASGRSLAFPAEKLAAQGTANVRSARGVRVNGGYAFVSSGADGVRIVDVSNPAKPTAVGTIDTDNAWAVAMRGSYAYIADGESGLRVVDVSAPRAPVLLGTRKTNDARAVALAGNYAYLADGDKGLKVIDITDTHTLARVGIMDSTNALDLVVSGKYLYLADGSGGLKVVDITKPAAPVVAAALATSDARAVALAPGLALVADGTAGLRVVDVSNPLKPVLLSTFTGLEASAVSAADGFAYVTDPSAGIRVVDLVDPAHPTLFTAHPMKGAAGVDVQNGYAYSTDGNSLDIMRVQIQGKSFRVAAAATGGKAYGVSVSGGWAYVAGHGQGINVIDLADPAHLSNASVAASFATQFAVSVSVQGSLAYVADGTNGVRIIDVSPAWDHAAGTAPADVGSYRPGGNVSKVAPAEGVAYVAAGDQGIRVLDIRTPSAPQEIGTVQTKNATDVLVKGSWAWVADGDGGVRVLDLSTPAQPRLLPAALSMNAKSLALSGNLLFAEGSTGVSIIDVSDPRAPVLKARYDSRTAQGIDASGNYVYVAEGYRGLTVLDVSRPTRPTVVSTCEDVFAVGVAVKGSYAIVADSAGVKVIQILIPDWLQ